MDVAVDLSLSNWWYCILSKHNLQLKDTERPGGSRPEEEKSGDLGYEGPSVTYKAVINRRQVLAGALSHS